MPNTQLTALAAVSPICVPGVAALLDRLDIEMCAALAPSEGAELADADADLAILETGFLGPEIDAALGEFLSGAPGKARRAVVVSACPSTADVYRALARGASGYLTLGSGLDELSRQLEEVLRGRTVVAPTIEASLADEIRTQAGRLSADDLLSPRQLAIVRMAADGVSPKEIATRLSISPLTVKSHFQVIYERLGVSDRAAAVAVALRRGLID